MTTFKGEMSTLILVERAKVIISEKIKILRDDLQKKFETCKANRAKSGNLNLISEEEKEFFPRVEKESTNNNTMKSNERVSSLNLSKNRNSGLHSSINMNGSKRYNFESDEDQPIQTIEKQNVDINSEVETNNQIR